MSHLFGNALAKQAQHSAEVAQKAAEAMVGALVIEQDKRLALEGRLKDNGQSQCTHLPDAQKAQQLMSDRLATADVRLSVLLDARDFAKGWRVPATPGTGGVDNAAVQARLDTAHASP